MYVKYAILLVVCCSYAARAYVDPGTGGLVFQVMLGVVVGGIPGTALFWKRIRVFQRSTYGKKPPQSGTDDEHDSSE